MISGPIVDAYVGTARAPRVRSVGVRVVSAHRPGLRSVLELDHDLDHDLHHDLHYDEASAALVGAADPAQIQGPA